MTRMSLREPGGEREFVVPLDAPPPGSPFGGPVELVVRTAPPGDAPVGVGLRFHPSDFEFQAWLPRLIETFDLPLDAFELGAGLAEGRPVLHFEADAAVVARVPAGLASLETMAAYLASGPALGALADYSLSAITFEP